LRWAMLVTLRTVFRELKGSGSRQLFDLSPLLLSDI
jgi:hypothetical protein